MNGETKHMVNMGKAEPESVDGGSASATAALVGPVDRLLRDLLQPDNRRRLERYRFSGSSNRVYRIPLADTGMSDAGDRFIIVKLLPSRAADMRRRLKRMLRNVLYGEHDISIGRQRAHMEVERVKEWAQEGLPVPPVIDTSLPNVRVFLGLPFPTFYTVLTDRTIPLEKKLDTLALVTQALSYQHQLAFLRLKKSLVHRDAGPWNIMVDMDRGDVHWFDLEHPADYPSMTLEDLVVRAFRIYLHGVLVYLRGHEDDVIRVVLGNYALKPIVDGYIQSMERYSRSLSYRVVGKAKKSSTSKLVERGTLGRVREAMARMNSPTQPRTA